MRKLISVLAMLILVGNVFADSCGNCPHTEAEADAQRGRVNDLGDEITQMDIEYDQQKYEADNDRLQAMSWRLMCVGLGATQDELVDGDETVMYADMDYNTAEAYRHGGGAGGPSGFDFYAYEMYMERKMEADMWFWMYQDYTESYHMYLSIMDGPNGVAGLIYYHDEMSQWSMYYAEDGYGQAIGIFMALYYQLSQQ